MSYSLNTTIINLSEKQKPDNAVILCHGYGGDGNDISILANYWKNYLPKTVFICPDAPERCAVSPTGFQWFDLMDQTSDEILTKSLVAEMKLNKLIDEVKVEYKLSADKIILCGFSQGCMISLQTGLKRQDKINSILPSFSTAFKSLSEVKLEFLSIYSLNFSSINYFSSFLA